VTFYLSINLTYSSLQCSDIGILQLLRQRCKTGRRVFNLHQRSKLWRLMQRPLSSQQRQKKREPQHRNYYIRYPPNRCLLFSKYVLA